ncbi:MAG TPA: AAA family ATPase [Aeromicrobium sp.]|nr:AAA family ATPase [Aeromicrobium sp.]HKY59180.1 AAA family ATPase [Aeromicrobium sp.]
MTDVLLVAVDHDLVERVAALGEHRVVSIDRNNVHGKHAGAPAETDFRPEIIFVGTGVSTHQAIEYARVIVGENPGISVILVAKPNRHLVRTAEKAGIHRVISERIKDRDLARILDHAGQAVAAETPDEKPRRTGKEKRAAKQTPVAPAPAVELQPPAKQPTPPAGGPGPHPHQVIVVASPKGGVGKTTTAVNLAALLAETAPGEVVVIDMDLQFGDVASILDLEPRYTITDAFASGADDSMRLRTLLVPHEGNFHVLCGSTDPAENGRVTGDQIRKLVHHYSSSFRYVVIDTPGGLHEETLASLEEATDVVFVAALDVATLRAMHREIDVLAQISLLPPRRHVVLNRSDRRSGLTERDAERIIGLPIDAVIPASERVALAGNRGELVVAARRRNPVRRNFKELARAVTDLSSQKGTLA